MNGGGPSPHLVQRITMDLEVSVAHASGQFRVMLWQWTSQLLTTGPVGYPYVWVVTMLAPDSVSSRLDVCCVRNQTGLLVLGRHIEGLSNAGCYSVSLRFWDSSPWRISGEQMRASMLIGGRGMPWTSQAADHSPSGISLWLSGYGIGSVSSRLGASCVWNPVGLLVSGRHIGGPYPVQCVSQPVSDCSIPPTGGLLENRRAHRVRIGGGRGMQWTSQPADHSGSVISL